jgi:nitrite reductase/ring-hydroxylating ferredoxin subunit
MQVEGLTHVATYRREVSASGERVWENVRDWEHLPWLHNESFRALEHLESGDWGWRVELSLASSDARTIGLELIIDAPRSRYVSRTTSGVGEGSEIWTTVTPLDANTTDIEVEFHLPGIQPEAVKAIGAVYTTLYTQLWDEDEEMMMLRESRLAGIEAPIEGTLELGVESEVRASLPLEVDFGGRPFRVAELDGDLVVYSAACPHLLGPLGNPDAKGRVDCPWHGYRFDLRSGASCDGRKFRLLPAPRLSIEPATRVVSLRAE